MGQQKDAFQIDENSKPYTHLNFKKDPDEFQFTIITENAGDLIEGYSDDEDQIRAWWQEIDDYLEQLEIPFFFVPGNQDFYSDAAIKVWRERFGGDRGYYHFAYKDALFMMVNTENPPKTADALQRDNPEL